MNARADFPDFDAGLDDHGSPVSHLRVPPYSLEDAEFIQIREMKPKDFGYLLKLHVDRMNMGG